MSVQAPVKLNFCTPIEFSKDFLAHKKPFVKALIAIGTAADAYVSFDKYTIQAAAMQKIPIKGHVWKTALRIISYVLTIFILPALALVAKAIYKNWAEKNVSAEQPVKTIHSSIKEPKKEFHEDAIQTYFTNFETLAKAEKWDDIIFQGTRALEEARKKESLPEEAKIYAQLTSTSFYQGNYSQALVYANRCHELSKNFTDPSLFVRALYLESAVYRALAGKNSDEQDQQKTYQKAVNVAEEALQLYSDNKIEDKNLEGKIYFNLGAAHADNPKGNLDEAERCYIAAIECFKNAADDLIRTNIRLGKIYLLKKDYQSSQNIIDTMRLQIPNERLAMHADYLEAQLKSATNDFVNATKIAKIGLERAKNLGAKEDENRFNKLMLNLEKP